MPRLNYANVMATLALFIALGGGAYAASLPRNSVGTAQIKKNAVTAAKIKTGAVSSSDVKDRSLLARDFRAGQLPAGPAGAKGDKGDPGAPGTNGTNGSTGPRGPSNAFESADNDQAPVDGTTEDSLSLPAGKFLVTAKADVENGSTGGAGTVTCSIVPTGGFPADQTTIELTADPGTTSPDSGVISLSAGIVLGAPNTVVLECTANGPAGELDNVRMHAIQVEDITFDEIV